ncbi:MAG: toll/interleukin-1 receptor domain-containing protein [Chloroflexi bacterium]|nr:MAG: toll/interleukin-1 receptor domain-containing protein [Chloroflexota bacterium]
MNCDIFLSYSVHDRRAATRLRFILEYYGLSPWPNHIMTPGTREWLDNYQAVMDTACCALLLLSPTTMDSAWVALMLDYAHTHHIPVMPLLVSGKADHILLATLNGNGDDWFDLRWNSRYLSEVRALIRWIDLCAQHIAVR